MITRKLNPIIYDYNMKGKALKRVEAQRDFSSIVMLDSMSTSMPKRTKLKRC